jgi:hypothetical protein
MGIFRAAARLSGLAVALGGATARAQAASTELSWSAPNACPAEASVQSDVERMLGQPLAERRDQKLRVEGTVREDATSRFVVTLRVTSARGSQRRELSSTDCQKVTEAAVLVIALAIDPTLVPPPSSDPPDPIEPAPTPEASSAAAAAASNATAAPTPAEPASEPAAPTLFETPAAPPRDERAVSAERAPTAAPWKLSGAAVGLASGGPLPGVALGAGARLSVGRGRFRVAVHGAYFVPKVEPVPGTSSAGIELALARVGVGLCGVPVLGNPAITACVGPAFGDMKGSGEGVQNPGTEHDRWSAVLAEVTVTHVTGFGLASLAGIEGGPAIDTPRFGITENGTPVEVYRASGWVLGGFLGVGFGN